LDVVPTDRGDRYPLANEGLRSALRAPGGFFFRPLGERLGSSPAVLALRRSRDVGPADYAIAPSVYVN